MTENKQKKPRTTEEKTAHAEYMRKWRANRTKRANEGDEAAIKSKNKDSGGGSYRSAKSFILKKATRRQLSELRDTIAERVKILNKEKKK